MNIPPNSGVVSSEEQSKNMEPPSDPAGSNLTTPKTKDDSPAHLRGTEMSSVSDQTAITQHVPSQSEEEKDYESEPSSFDKRKRKGKSRYNQSRAVHPNSRMPSKELRELRRNHAILEKNLKIEGLPEPPKFRKRRASVGSSMNRAQDKDFAFKRRRLGSIDHRPRKDHMPKWELLGGDAGDPLNLNGLANSEEGRLLNMKTPESSPLPTPAFRKVVYVKIPPNIEDPLNLEGRHDQRVIDMMLDAPIKKRHRSKKKHDGTLVKPDRAKEDEKAETTPNHPPISVEEMSTPEGKGVSDVSAANSAEKKSMSRDAGDASTPVTPIKLNIATPTSEQTPTPTTSSEYKTPTKIHTRRSSSRSLSRSPDRLFKRQLSGCKGKIMPQEPKKFPEKPVFTFGNYNRYYGYRNRNNVPDPRLQYFSSAWFAGLDVLDIGCNVGHVTLALAEQFEPNKILGIDIDGKLIQAARQNIRHMLSHRRKDTSKYPRVLEMTRGSLEAHPLITTYQSFPNNVLFLQGNYVPGSEELLELVKEEYDTILALSITKWIHLNNGDFGLKLFFQKMFRNLHPGGKLILEPQPWATYRKRAKLTPDMFKNYQSIKLKPEAFKHYLLSIGFVKCEVLAVPVTKAKGFRRPLILFTKGCSKSTPGVLPSQEQYMCPECNNSECVCHEGFTGMRRGGYADYRYDHFNYPRASDYPDQGMVPWGGAGLGAQYTSDSFNPRRSSSRLSSPSYRFSDYTERPPSGNGSAGAYSATSSSSGSSSLTGSSTGSSSTGTGVSTRTSDYSSSTPSVMNGDIANEVDWEVGGAEGLVNGNHDETVVWAANGGGGAPSPPNLQPVERDEVVEAMDVSVPVGPVDQSVPLESSSGSLYVSSDSAGLGEDSTTAGAGVDGTNTSHSTGSVADVSHSSDKSLSTMENTEGGNEAHSSEHISAMENSSASEESRKDCVERQTTSKSVSVGSTTTSEDSCVVTSMGGATSSCVPCVNRDSREVSSTCAETPSGHSSSHHRSDPACVSSEQISNQSDNTSGQLGHHVKEDTVTGHSSDHCSDVADSSSISLSTTGQSQSVEQQPVVTAGHSGHQTMDTSSGDHSTSDEQTAVNSEKSSCH